MSEYGVVFKLVCVCVCVLEFNSSTETLGLSLFPHYHSMNHKW